MIWIQTFSGNKLDLSKPTSEMFSIEDVVHGLVYECRWASQTKYFYSVAQHSIYCCAVAPLHLKLEALMHDWTEAFIKDIPSPIKKSILNYKGIENKLYNIGIQKFNLDWHNIDSHLIIKEIDERMGATEARDLMKSQEHTTYKHIEPYVFRIVPMTFEQVYSKFMQMFELYKRN